MKQGKSVVFSIVSMILLVLWMDNRVWLNYVVPKAYDVVVLSSTRVAEKMVEDSEVLQRIFFNPVSGRNVISTGSKGFQLYGEAVLRNENMPTTIRGRLGLQLLTFRSFATARNTFLEGAKEAPASVWETPLRRPIVIAGVGRSGTSFLQRLLSLDNNGLNLRLADMIEQTKIPIKVEDREESNRKLQEEDESLIKKMIVGFNNPLDKWHHSRMWLTEEDVAIKFHNAHIITKKIAALLSQKENETNAYVKWMGAENVDDDVYHYHYRFLQYFQSLQNPNHTHWLLKSPVHAFNLESTLRRMPSNTHVILVHRNTAKTLPSFAHTILATFANEWDEKKLSKKDFLKQVHFVQREQYQKLCDFVEAHPEWKNDASRLTNLTFEEIMADPMKVIEKIYANAGLIVTDAFRAKVHDYIESEKIARKNHPGISAYSIADFDVTEQEVFTNVSEFDRYHSMFNV